MTGPQDDTTKPRAKKDMRNRRTIAMVALVTMAAGGVLYLALGDDHAEKPGGGASKGLVQGSLSLRPGGSYGGDGSDTGGPTCRSNDFAEGTAVVVSNGTDEKVAVGRLDAGTLGDPNINDIKRCRFDFAVEVPRGHGIYSVSIGSLASEDYTEAELFGGPLTYKLGGS